LVLFGLILKFFLFWRRFKKDLKDFQKFSIKNAPKNFLTCVSVEKFYFIAKDGTKKKFGAKKNLEQKKIWNHWHFFLSIVAV